MYWEADTLGMWIQWMGEVEYVTLWSVTLCARAPLSGVSAPPTPAASFNHDWNKKNTMKISHISTSCKVKYVLWAATSNWQLSLTQTVPLWILFVSPQRGNLAADTVLDKCRSVNKKQRKNRCTSSSWQMALCASDAIVNCLVLKSLTQLEVSQRVTEYIKHDPTE